MLIETIAVGDKMLKIRVYGDDVIHPPSLDVATSIQKGKSAKESDDGAEGRR
jgi:hypothetical protein